MASLKNRPTAWRRHKDRCAARRKRAIDENRQGTWSGNGVYVHYYPWLHAYSKGKVHCSCEQCSGKYRSNGWTPFSPKTSDKRKLNKCQAALDEYFF